MNRKGTEVQQTKGNSQTMIYNIDDLNNLTDADFRDIFDNIELQITETKHKSKTIDQCPYCAWNEIMEDTTNGILVCTNNECGQVIDSIMDQNPEWRQYEDDGKNDGRCSAPINQLLPLSSLGSSISGSYKNRLKTLQTWNSMPYRERSLNGVFKRIHEVCINNKIIKCIEDDAKIMYKTVSDCKHVIGKGKGRYIIIRGKNRDSLIAACIFFACRKNEKTRTPLEISLMFNLKYTEITKGCKNFLKLMKLKNTELAVGTSKPEHFVTRFCNDLKLNSTYTDQAIKIARNIQKLSIASVHTPFSTAMCSILLMCEVNNIQSITKKRLSQEFDLSEVTLTKAYNKIEKYRKALLNDEITDKLVKKLEAIRINHEVPDAIKERLKKFESIEEPKIVKQEPTIIQNSVIKNYDSAEYYDDADIFDELDNDNDNYENVYDTLRDELYFDINEELSEIFNADTDYLKSIADGNDRLYNSLNVPINKKNQLLVC